MLTIAGNIPYILIGTMDSFQSRVSYLNRFSLSWGHD